MFLNFSQPIFVWSLVDQWRNFVIETTGSNARINDVPRYATFTHPGLPPRFLNTHGYPDIVALLKFTDDVFDIGVRLQTKGSGTSKTMIDWYGLMEGSLTFFAATQYSFSRALYDPTIPKWPLDAKVSLGNIGNTSLDLIVDIFTPGASEPIVHQVSSNIRISRETRKPNPFSGWLREELKGKGVLKEKFRVEKLSRPERTFVHKVKAMSSACDGNNHVNFSSYIMYGVDAIRIALSQTSRNQGSSETNYVTGRRLEDTRKSDVSTANTSDYTKTDDVSHTQNQEKTESDDIDISQTLMTAPYKLPWFTMEVMKNGMKNLKICFLNESLEGEELDVHIWQEKGEELAVMCSVERQSDVSVICQFVMEYFGPSNKL